MLLEIFSFGLLKCTTSKNLFIACHKSYNLNELIGRVWWQVSDTQCPCVITLWIMPKVHEQIPGYLCNFLIANVHFNLGFVCFTSRITRVTWREIRKTVRITFVKWFNSGERRPKKLTSTHCHISVKSLTTIFHFTAYKTVTNLEISLFCSHNNVLLAAIYVLYLLMY